MSHSTTGTGDFKLSFLRSCNENEEGTIYGTGEQLVEAFHARTTAGCPHFQLRFADFPNMDGVELFAKRSPATIPLASEIQVPVVMVGLAWRWSAARITPRSSRMRDK